MKRSHTNLFNNTFTKNQFRQKQLSLTMQQKLNNMSLTQSIGTCDVKLPIQKYQKQLKSIQTQTNSKHSFDATQILLKQTSLKLKQSENIIKQFYQTRKSLIVNKENSDNSPLNKELITTKQRLRKRQYGFNISNQPKQSKKQNNYLNTNSQPNKIKQKLNQNEYKKLDINQKTNLIKNIISQSAFKQVTQQIQNKVQMLKKKYHSEPQLRQKVIKYYTSYEILGIFLQQLSKDPSKLALKSQNIQTYYLVKQQMIGLVSNQEHFNSHIEQLLNKQTLRQNSLIPKTLQQQQKFLKLHSFESEFNERSSKQKSPCNKKTSYKKPQKPSYKQKSSPNKQKSSPNKQKSSPNKQKSSPNKQKSSPNKQKSSPNKQKSSPNKRQKMYNSQGCQQLSRIQQLLIEAKQDIKEAFRQFGKVQKTYQIELQFSNRKKGSFNQINNSNMLLINCGFNQSNINLNKLN